MVAMVLGLLIIVGVLSVFLANKQTYGRSEDLSLYQEKARFVSDLITQDIRQADGTPCRKRDSTYTINTGDSDLVWGDDLAWGDDDGIKGYSGDPNSEVPGEVAFGTGDADRVAGTDALRVTGTLGVVFSVLSCSSPTFTLNYPPGVTAHGFDSGSNLIICDFEDATLFEKVGSSASTVSFDPATLSCDDYPQNSLISEASQVLWYLGCNGLPDKPCNTPAGRSLYRNPGRPVIDGVADLQIEYLSRDGTAYEELANGWGDVVAVRLTLDLEPPQPGAGEDTPPTPRLLQVIALRNRIPL